MTSKYLIAHLMTIQLTIMASMMDQAVIGHALRIVRSDDDENVKWQWLRWQRWWWKQLLDPLGRLPALVMTACLHILHWAAQIFILQCFYLTLSNTDFLSYNTFYLTLSNTDFYLSRYKKAKQIKTFTHYGDPGWHKWSNTDIAQDSLNALLEWIHSVKWLISVFV